MLIASEGVRWSWVRRDLFTIESGSDEILRPQKARPQDDTDMEFAAVLALIAVER